MEFGIGHLVIFDANFWHLWRTSALLSAWLRSLAEVEQASTGSVNLFIHEFPVRMDAIEGWPAHCGEQM